MRNRPGKVEQDLQTANAEQNYLIDQDQLPLHCPLPDMYLWNSHPKVFLPIQATGTAKCPYCGTNYSLATDEKS